MKICVLIPSYNEAKTIGSLARRIKAKGLDAIVVDDGSSDETSEEAKRFGAFVIRQKENRGKGASLKVGFADILNKDYDAVITMDGDGQHSPEDISKFIEAAFDPGVDMVVGDRMGACKNMPFLRWATNNFTSLMISVICWRNIRDSQCGFRLIKRKVLEVLDPTSSKYEIESETIIAAQRKGFKIKFVPIETIYAKQTSQINPIVDTIRFFRFILKSFCPFLFNKR